MSAYEIATMACADSLPAKATFMALPASKYVIIGHLRARSRVVDPHHADLLSARIGAQPLGPMLNQISARDGDNALQTFLLEGRAGLPAIHWAAMTDLTAVENVMEQAQRLGILSEVIAQNNTRDGWTVLHTIATSVVHCARHAVDALPSFHHEWRQRLHGQMEMLSQTVISLRFMLPSLDGFCQLMHARGSPTGLTFVLILEVIVDRTRRGPGLPLCSLDVNVYVRERVDDIAAFIGRRCNNIGRR
ncbi:unnamed protein product (mitochondrion) [Plasmodiophora brassicae]|uniref:Uncharacterized protein n=1 Tax=Plasmodiophora brassicae TaxID=37360 RepID=A0A3P3YGY7_PLABS|nr:unnamed protein product [Plasmodiophora brassicae]